MPKRETCCKCKTLDRDLTKNSSKSAVFGKPAIGHNTVSYGRRTARLRCGSDYWEIEYKTASGDSYFPTSYGIGSKVSPEYVLKLLKGLEGVACHLDAIKEDADLKRERAIARSRKGKVA